MKLFIVVLAVFLTFSDARNPEADRLLKSGFRSGGFVKKLATRFNDRRGSYRDPATANVSVSAQWSYTDGDKVTALTISAKNLNSAQWAAVGLGQNKSSMVNMRESFSKGLDRFFFYRVKLMYSCVNDFQMIQLF